MAPRQDEMAGIMGYSSSQYTVRCMGDQGISDKEGARKVVPRPRTKNEVLQTGN